MFHFEHETECHWAKLLINCAHVKILTPEFRLIFIHWKTDCNECCTLNVTGKIMFGMLCNFVFI